MGLVIPMGMAAATIPEFTYTGTYSLIDDGDGNWRIKFLTSGTLTITNGTFVVDTFLVGGGAGAYNAYWSGGGGGGYTNLQSNITLQKNTPYSIVIGAGGNNANGGNTTGFGYTANGGVRSTDTISGAAGNGGCGGGGYGSDAGGAGGSNGSNGSAGSGADHQSGGTGQGTTTREFHEAAGDLYAGGGGGGGVSVGGAGGAGGGGAGTGNGVAGNGTANTGGGGGGRGAGTAGLGGSGIIVIRNHRAA